MQRPADALAVAPVARFAKFESFGSAEEWLDCAPLPTVLRDCSRLDRATFWRRAFRVVKYRAEPTPVRRVEGSVPRQNDWIVCGLFNISLKEDRKELELDCWTRVFNKSAGWRRIAEVMPDTRPATKCAAVGISV
jgi:hypothetical protein